MQSGIYENITSWDDLAAIPTRLITNPVIVDWVDATTQAAMRTQLRPSTAASDPTNGVQRPNDYGTSNLRVWFEC